MPHILVAGKIHEAGLPILRAAKGFTVELVNEVTVESYAPLLPRADALLLRTQPLTPDMIATAPHLKIVSRHGVGYDAVNVAALSQRNIPLCIVGDVNSRAVAEHTLMLMLAAGRRTVAHDHAARTGQWNERNKFDAVELDSKHLLLLGFGRIGRRVATLAQAFGMIVSAFDPHIGEPAMAALNCTKASILEDALQTADFVSLHLPAATSPVIGTSQFAAMKQGAILVNAARGELIDEAALDHALRSRHIRHAAIDVFSQEPPRAEHPLLSNPHITISPHNAGLTDECAARMAIASVQNILHFFDGTLDPGLVVNAEAIIGNT
jgi:D-3-phosphoglycerate dehydrogenase / 2-oxoglutarate reductase